MERFVFVVAIAGAIIFGVVAVFGGPHVFHADFDDDDGGFGTAAIVAVSPGRMETQAFAGGELRIRHIAANVTITPEDRTDFAVEIDNSAGRLPMPTVASDNGRVVIDGQLRGRVRDCTSDGGASIRGYGEGAFAAADLPRITIRAPRDVHLDRSGAGVTEIGASQSLDLDLSGCSLTTAGDTAGELSVDVAGSGAVHAGAAHSLNADVAGSADISVGTVTTSASIDIAGSGSVTIASLTGELNADGAGSGDIAVQGGAVTRASIDLAGSGGVSIAAPVEDLNVSIVGSGDVDVAGVVGNLDADIAGSGGVSAQSVTGTVRQEVWGSGEVSVGQ